MRRRTIAIGLLCVAALDMVGNAIGVPRIKKSFNKVYKEESTLPEPEKLESKIARVGIGKNRIYFRHMRKAAGSQMRQLLFRTLTDQHQKNIVSQPKIGAAKGFLYYEMEYGAFDAHCVEAAPRNKVLTIAVLRDPLARLWSEFWYKLGPTSGFDRLLNESDLFVESALLNWVNAGRGTAHIADGQAR
jgi:hypothetical protein